MSEEIKLTFDVVEQALSSLRASAETVNPDNIGVVADNQLQMAERLNAINEELEAIVSSYQSLLLHNEEATKNAVHAWKEVDEQAAGSIQSLDLR